MTLPFGALPPFHPGRTRDGDNGLGRHVDRRDEVTFDHPCLCFLRQLSFLFSGVEERGKEGLTMTG